MILPIFLYGSKVLREVAAPVDLENEDRAALTELLDNMDETMKKADGCGIAAPQVGVGKRMLIVDGSDLIEKYPELKDFYRRMINPEIVSESEETSEYNEGCLSIPDVDADIVRPKVITVRYYDGNFEPREETFDDFAARMVQHEMDHLDGIVFTDHATPIRKKLISGKLRGISKGCVNTRYKAKVVN
jgi:peptide deformylase